ncbi:hypothetical protein THAOC_27530, partial [Thalassiosira oceanica]
AEQVNGAGSLAPRDERGALGTMAGSTIGAAGANEDGLSALERRRRTMIAEGGRNRPGAWARRTTQRGGFSGAKVGLRRLDVVVSRVRGIVRAAPEEDGWEGVPERTCIPSPFFAGLLALGLPGGYGGFPGREDGTRTTPVAAAERSHLSAGLGGRQGKAPLSPLSRIRVPVLPIAPGASRSGLATLAPSRPWSPTGEDPRA